jgi:hypothetical protein
MVKVSFGIAPAEVSRNTKSIVKPNKTKKTTKKTTIQLILLIFMTPLPPTTSQGS